jgi:hypothetical protein
MLYCAAAGSIAKHKTAEAARQARVTDIMIVSIHRAKVDCLHRPDALPSLARSGDFAVTPITLFGTASCDDHHEDVDLGAARESSSASRFTAAPPGS